MPKHETWCDWFRRQLMVMQGQNLSIDDKAAHLAGNYEQVVGPAMEKAIAEWVALPGNEEVNLHSVAAQKSLAAWIVKGEGA